MFSFFVDGIPAPQGSKNGFVKSGRVVMVESSKKVKPWREAVARETELAMNRHMQIMWTEPLEVSLVFYLPKPKTVTREFPSVKPDLDKLIRSTFDGMTTGGLYVDDALVIAVTATKLYGNRSGCLIHVTNQVTDV